MRKVVSYLIILVFLTAYGRCVADQFGMLHTGETSCCTTVCDTSDHCPTDDTDGNDPHSNEHDPEAPDDPEQPAPCQLCFILDSDSMMLEDAVQVPSPVLLELPDSFFFTATLDDILQAHVISFSPELTRSDNPDTSLEERSRLLRIEVKAIPVRGPSIV